MPRNAIDIPDQIDYLSILDADGNLDESLEPEISDDLLMKLYRAMVAAREFDARLLALQRQGRIGTFPPITGQEASQLGAIAVVKPSDWFVPSFREGAAEAWRGRTLKSFLFAANGFNEGFKISDDQNDLPVSVPVGSHMIHATGIAWGIKYRKKEEIVITFFGDGATSEGDFHEAMNFAGVFELPVIFVCQNNQWAISVPRKKQTRSKTIAQKAIGYGVKGIQVDGNDILAVYAAAKEAEERARNGEGPTLIECVTYRMMMHTTADDPKKYRSEEEVESWKEKDPISRFKIYLKNKELLDDDAAESIHAEVLEEIKQAVNEAEEEMKSMTDPLPMFDHLYAEPTPSIRAHREYFEGLMEARGGEVT